MTIYGKDTTDDPCSSDVKEIAQPIACYNSTYYYYSIDMCDPVAALPSNSPVAKKSHTGTIVGGGVGGVIGLALILGVVFWIVRKKRQERQTGAIQDSSTEQWNELQGQQQNELQGRQQNEIGSGKVMYRREAVEVEVPPVELSGVEMSTSGKIADVEAPPVELSGEEMSTSGKAVH